MRGDERPLAQHNERGGQCDNGNHAGTADDGTDAPSADKGCYHRL